MHVAVRESLFVRRSMRIAPFIGFSIGAHVVAVAIVVVLGLLNRPPPIDLDQKPIKASLVRLGKPRDERLLPRIQEAPAPPKEKTGPAPLPDPKPAAKSPSPDAKVPAPDAKQAGKQEGEDARKRLFGAFERAGAKPEEEVEGALDGDPYGDSAVAEGERYYAAMKSAIRRYYDVSQTIPDQERIRLSADVLIRVAPNGELIQAKLVKPSGNSLYDSAVLSAVKKAAPFAPPPQHLRKELERGITLGFTP